MKIKIILSLWLVTSFSAEAGLVNKLLAASGTTALLGAGAVLYFCHDQLVAAQKELAYTLLVRTEEGQELAQLRKTELKELLAKDKEKASDQFMNDAIEGWLLCPKD